MVLSLPKAAGGGPGWQVAGLLSSAIDSVICHRFSHLSSIQPSTAPLIQPLRAIIPIVTEM